VKIGYLFKLGSKPCILVHQNVTGSDAA